MKHISIITILSYFLFIQNINSQVGDVNCKSVPQIDQLKMWFNEKEHKANFPKIKYRVGGVLKHENDIYFVNKKLRTVDIYLFNFKEKKWQISKDSTLFHALEYTYKDKYLASGLSAVELVGDTLFLGGVCKTAFCTVDINNKQEVYQTACQLPDYHGSEKVSGIAFEYPHLYIAYHSSDYEIEIEKTQRLISIDVRTDSIKFNTELNISENRRDAAHGLTSINGEVWHMKDNVLTKMNGENGAIIETFQIGDVKRPASLCYLNNSLWIVTYYGGLYELPFKCE